MTKSKTPTETAASGVAAMTEAMMSANPAMAKLWSDMATESARFVSERLQEDVKAQREMLACKTPAELAKVQAEFFQKAMSQYTAEAYKMFEIMTDAGGEAVKGAKTGTSRGYDDVPV
ncbi:phasin family protein [Roseovarius aestuariivivens]|uniref:phasin family protein n=1 Tax=Roseovarius aestuariivivens TaxID=1888910 RepID=UPI001436AC0D|nr:phasin family protein [Roseovarius aestuariivivens]